MKTLCTLLALALPLLCEAATIKGKVFQVVSDGLLVDVTPMVISPITFRMVPGDFKLVMLKNYPFARSVVDGEAINCEADADGRYQYVATSGGSKTIEQYRCPDPPPPPRPPTEEELRAARRREQAAWLRAELERDAMKSRVLAYQHQQASNGYPSFQLELGKRYLRGDGVPTNWVMATHWLQSACTNRDSEASNLLSQIRR